MVDVVLTQHWLPLMRFRRL
eukprot:CCRYP_013952-RA/>CCRYP_013952-RA protein AED:0.35 eAED:1.00 QI:0/-1/0/1/-1/0/1/0/19